MQKTGELLKKTREEKKLSLHEIGLALKIGTKVLKAIEEGDEKNLPAKTFLRGFVRSYAAYLRLDVDEVLNLFQEEMGSTRPPGAIARSIPEETTNELPKHFSEPEAVGNVKHSNNMKPLLFALICVVAVAVITLAKKVVEKYQRETEIAAIPQAAKPIDNKDSGPEVETPASVTNALADAVTSDKLAPANAPAAAGAATSAATSATAPNSAATASSAAATTTTAAAHSNSAGTTANTANANAPTAAGVTKPSAPAAASATATAAAPVGTSNAATGTATTTTAAKPAATPTPGPAQAAGKSLELIVEAMEGVEIEYSAVGGKTEKIKLSAEQVHTFKSKAGLRLSVSNGGAINLILNGKDLGVPGEIGKPIKLSY